MLEYYLDWVWPEPTCEGENVVVIPETFNVKYLSRAIKIAHYDFRIPKWACFASFAVGLLPSPNIFVAYIGILLLKRF